MKLYFSIRGAIESTSVAAVLIFVLLPVRIFFVRYVSDDWFGSFGLILGISILILVLAKKNKLGWFGRAFHRQMFKLHHGKRRYFFYTQLVLGTIFFIVTIHAINIGDQYQEEKIQLRELLDIESVEEFIQKSEEEIKPEDIPQGFAIFLYILFFRFDIYSIMISTIDDMFDGYVLHFSTVFLVEEIELIGIAILTRFTVKKEKIDDAF